MFVDELRASLGDWTRKWHSYPYPEYVRRYDALTPAQRDEAYVLLARAREAMTALQLLFREGR